MVRLEAIIGVKDVATSSKWYQLLLGCKRNHEGKIFDKLVDKDGTVLLCLHKWGAHEHPTLRSPDNGGVGNGLILYFRADNYDEIWDRAKKLQYKIEEEPYFNHEAGNSEFILRDPDGYFVTVCAPSIYE